MKRRLYARLVRWKSSPRRKPLLLQGALQTGKTFLLREFGRKRYERVHYCNFEEDRCSTAFLNVSLIRGASLAN